MAKHLLGVGKYPDGSYMSYEQKVAQRLTEMLGFPVNFSKNDTAAIVGIPPPNQELAYYNKQIPLDKYWEFAKGKHPNYVAQFIAEKHIKDDYTKNYYQDWKKNNTYHLYDLANWKPPVVPYLPKPVPVPKPKITVDVSEFKDQLHKIQAIAKQLNEQMQQQMLPAFEEIAKAMTHTTKVVEANAIKQMPARAVTKHPGLNVPTRCPGYDKYLEFTEKCHTKDSLESIIIHLNDEHQWTREAIADWLDTLDSQPVFYPDIPMEEENAAG